jgi:hypothetical protein
VYKYLHPTATPAQVRQALISRARHSGCGAAPGGPCSDDPDTVDEPLLSMWHLDDGFERYAVGASLAQYEEKPAGVPGAITVSSTAQAGTRSAGLSLTPDGIAPVDFLAGKFCLPTASQDRFKANLKLRLDSFVAWNALVVTGTTDPTLYWWWIGPSGTVWDDTIVGTMSAGVWHDVEISINRTAGSATIALDGAAHVTALSPAWPSSSDPMLCLKVTSGVDVGQALYADEVLISIGD